MLAALALSAWEGAHTNTASCHCMQLCQPITSHLEHIASLPVVLLQSADFASFSTVRAGILDIRIWNTDRHAGNILVRRPRAASIANLGALARLDSAQLELVPIDHGFCLPESLDPPYLEWLHWPAVRPSNVTPVSSQVGSVLLRILHLHFLFHSLP